MGRVAVSVGRQPCRRGLPGRLVPLILAVLIGAAPAWSALPQATMLWVAVSGSQSIAWITKEAGYFGRNGVDINLQFISGSPTAAAALESGHVNFVQMAGPAVVTADAAGGHLVMVMGFVNQPVFVLMVTPDIQTPEQLKGKTIAVVKVGSSDDFMLREALSHWGLKPGTDVQVTGVGSIAAQIAALDKRVIQGLVVDPPNDVLASRAGAHVLARIADLGISYQAAGLATTREYIQTHPDVVEKVVRAMSEGVHRFKTDRVYSEEIMAKYLKNSDPVVVDAAYNAYAGIIPRVPAPTRAGMQEILKQMGSDKPLKQALDVGSMIDTSFVERLQARGFFQQLYK